MRFSADDGALVWRGAAEIARDGDRGVAFWRVPRWAVEESGSPDMLVARATTPAGVRLELATDARELVVELWGDELQGPLDLVVDGQRWRRHPLDAGPQVARIELPGRLVDLDVMLPNRGSSRVSSVEFAGATVVRTRRDDRPRWFAYGSSITQGAFSDGPEDAWPAIVARRAGWSLHNAGLGAECHLDPAIARHLRAEPAELITLCLGINIYGQESFSRRTLRPAILGFLQTVAEGHPATPIVVISPIGSPDREEAPNGVGLTLAEVRSIVADAAEYFRATTRPDLVVVDGRTLLGRDEAGLLVDGLHPGSEGYALIAERVLDRLAAAGISAGV